MTTARASLLALSSVALLATATSYAASPQPAAASAGTATEGYRRHVAAAEAAAKGVGRNVLNLCQLPQAEQRRGPPKEMMQGAASIKPGKVFDNLYYVGLPAVSAWVVKTSAGLILIDALSNAADAQNTIIPGIRAVGLDPAQIRYVVITHGHFDHFGGVPYIVEQFHPHVLASDADWKLMAGPPVFADAPKVAAPKRDMTVTDGQKLTLGDTTITLHLTPGHTPGTVSLVIPLTDHGQQHTAALWGGTAFNFTPAKATFDTYAASADRFRSVAEATGADVLLSNHGFVDGTPTKLPLVENRKAGEPNPYVVGRDEVASFLTVAGDCARARAAAL